MAAINMLQNTRPVAFCEICQENDRGYILTTQEPTQR